MEMGRAVGSAGPGLVVSLASHDLDKLGDDLVKFRRAQGADSVKDSVRVRREESIRADVAVLAELPGREVGGAQRDGIGIRHGAAGDLTEYDIVAPKCRHDEHRASLRPAEVREREGKDDHVALGEAAERSA